MKNSSHNTSRSRAKQGSISGSHLRHNHSAEIASAHARLPADRAVNDMAGLFDVLSNPMRLRIVLALRPAKREAAPELCVSDLAAILNASESLTSHQLRILRDAALVSQRKEGKLVLYQIADGALDDILPALDERGRARS